MCSDGDNGDADNTIANTLDLRVYLFIHMPERGTTDEYEKLIDEVADEYPAVSAQYATPIGQRSSVVEVD